MNNFLEELRIAAKVLAHWETLAALVGFILLWSLFRYVALVRRKPSGRHFHLPRRRAPPVAAEPEAQAEQGEEEEEKGSA